MVKVQLQMDTNYGILYQKVQQKSCAFFYSYETGGSSVDKIGKYRVLKKIGSGGTGSVYVVLDDRIGKKWAMKELPKSKKGGRDGLFVLKGLDHPSIPRIVEELEDEYCVYEIMDYIEGVTLAEYAGAGRIRSAEQLLAICTEISGIIAYLHSREPPIIFRDIKPDNFIVTGDGNIKLVDFDIALVGEQTDNMPLGTRGYAAPEQHFGICSMAADVYSLGVTIGELAHKLRLAPGISRVFDKRILMKIRRVSGKAAGKDPVSRYSDGGAVWEEMVRIRRTYRAERTAAIAGTVLLLLTVLTASLRGIYRDAVKSDARNRVLTYLESSRKTADRIMCELAEDRGADVDEDLAGFYKEVMKAGSLTKYTDEETAK
jgi:serine/threonine-protein kinase